MSQIVEISLRIPSLRVARADSDTPKTISNAEIRFCKQIEVDAIPKPGVVLTMSGSDPFDCEVIRSDWHDEKNMFVIACRYAKKSVSPAEYQRFLTASDWQARPLI